MSRLTGDETTTWGPIPNRWAIGLALKFRVIKLKSGEPNFQSKMWYPNSFRNYFLQSLLALALGFTFAHLVARTGIVDGLFSGDDWKVSNIILLQTTDVWVNSLTLLVIVQFQFLWMLLFWKFVGRRPWKFGINMISFFLILAVCILLLSWRLSEIPQIDYDLYTKDPAEFVINWVVESFVLFIGFDSSRVIKGQRANVKHKSRWGFDWTKL